MIGSVAREENDGRLGWELVEVDRIGKAGGCLVSLGELVEFCEVESLTLGMLE